MPRSRPPRSSLSLLMAVAMLPLFPPEPEHHHGCPPTTSSGQVLPTLALGCELGQIPGCDVLAHLGPTSLTRTTRGARKWTAKWIPRHSGAASALRCSIIPSGSRGQGGATTMGGDDSRGRGRCLDAAATAGGGGGWGGSGLRGGRRRCREHMTLVRSPFFHQFPRSSFHCKKVYKVLRENVKR